MKQANLLAPEGERLAAVSKAVKDIPHVKASDFEFSLSRPSYTANTLRELQKAYPDTEFTLIIGEDNIAIFDRWREYEFILANFRIFVYPRRENLSDEDLTAKRSNSPQNGLTTQWSNSVAVKEIRYLSGAPLFDISSTQIRNQQAKAYV